MPKPLKGHSRQDFARQVSPSKATEPQRFSYTLYATTKNSGKNAAVFCGGDKRILPKPLKGHSRQDFARQVSPSKATEPQRFSYTLYATTKNSGKNAAVFCGGDKRIRTAGLLVANEALYQLSHTPVTDFLQSRLLLYTLFDFFSTVFNRFFAFLQKNIFLKTPTYLRNARDPSGFS